MPIEAMNGLSGVWPAKMVPGGMLCCISSSRARVGFSSNATTWPVRSKLKMPIADASSSVTGCAATVMSARRSMCESTSSSKFMRYS